jgi:hypothetical protein
MRPLDHSKAISLELDFTASLSQSHKLAITRPRTEGLTARLASSADANWWNIAKGITIDLDVSAASSMAVITRRDTVRCARACTDGNYHTCELPVIHVAQFLTDDSISLRELIVRQPLRN